MKKIIVFLSIIMFGCAGPATPKQDPSPVATKVEQQGISPTPTPSVNTTAPVSPASTQPMENKATANISAPAAGNTFTCKSGNDERVVEKIETGNGCQLKYTKFGEATVIASSTQSTVHCNKVSEQIKANLEKHGFTCQ